MPRRAVLSDEQRAALLALPDDETLLVQHWTLSRDDLAIIVRRRRPHNRLGFAIQLCALRYPGRFLRPGELIPDTPLAFVAEQLQVGPEVLADYLAQGMEAQADGASRRLSFRREVETAIYNTMPHTLLQEFKRHPFQCPVAFIGGTRSRESRTVGLSGTRQIVGQRLSWIQGSHLYPFERPAETVAEVLAWLRHFETGAPAPAPKASDAQRRP